MLGIRLVSSEAEDQKLISHKMLKNFQILLWKDPVLEESLKAMSHEGKICPAILKWRDLCKS